jgi:hypothetical protein
MIAALIWFVIYIVVIGCIFWLLTWLIDYVGLPEPFHRIARIIIAVVAVIIVLLLLLRLLGVDGGQGFPKLGFNSSVYGLMYGEDAITGWLIA